MDRGDGVERDQGGVSENREERWKDVQHVHCCFDEHEEHGEDGDDEIEVCDAGVGEQRSILDRGDVGKTYNWPHTLGAVYGL